MFKVLVILIFICAAKAIPIQKFYSFGNEHGDTELARVQHETSSSEIALSVPVKYYGESYSSVYVNSNGLLSFLTPLPNFINVQFPLDYPVITALYANTDLRRSGHVYYRETQSEHLLNRATTEIRRAFPRTNFQAKSLFIATWYQVGYHHQGWDKVNTFQVVIASDGKESFVEFLYADEGIQWLQGTGHPETGIPDAKAQAGFVAYNGRTFQLQGSGTDQIRNLIRLSNAVEGGVWIFRVGDIGSDLNIESPNSQEILASQINYPDRESSCANAFTLCHSQATCKDTDARYCCVCRKDFYGNGYNCLREGIPMRVSGKINIDVNGVKVSQQDFQAYVVVADGRAYTAISKIPTVLGSSLQLLYPVTTVLNWLFAIPTGTGLNGFQITGGVLNHSAELTYKETNDRISIIQKYSGLDVFDQLKVEVQIFGKVPYQPAETKIQVNDYQIQLNFVGPGMFRSSSSLSYKEESPYISDPQEHHISLEQTISFKESCTFGYNLSTGNFPSDSKNQYSYFRIKSARNFVNYEVKENILRFAATSKVSLLTENEDPCLEGRLKCVANSSCVVEGDSFRCICNPGFQATFSNRYPAKTTYDLGCVDVNECTEGKAACHENAICVNEIGSYQCSCKQGYTGNGWQCSEIELPCGKDFSLCNPIHSRCSNRNDYTTCDCDAGFRKEYIDDKRIGFVCADVNECEALVCSQHENCINLEGSYVCECRNAPGSNRSCKNLEVSCNEVNNCSPNADCLFNETSQRHTCICIRGYYGDGYFCKAYGGFQVVQRICTTDRCICPPDFLVVDNWCVADGFMKNQTISTVSCNVLPNMCHQYAQCILDSKGQYQCVCNTGFEGNGLECIEAEISCLKNDICDVHATCQVNERTGKARCVCKVHYHGDGTHCEYAGTCTTDSDCGVNEECFFNEDPYAYECRCKKNFVRFQNEPCRPVRPCPACHQFGRCVADNVTKDGVCECLSGYRGDGVYTCEKVVPPCNIENNCSPNAKCDFQPFSNSFECQCKQGFAGNGTFCYDVRTCFDVPELCDKNAKCLVKAYGLKPECECNAGFMGNGAVCAEIPKYEGGFLFVNYGMTTIRVPYEPSQQDPGFPIQAQTNQVAVGLTIDCLWGRVYWSDYSGHKIKSSGFRGKNITTLVESNITAIEGLTLDWINRILYWADSGKRIIESIKLDNDQRKIIASANLSNPRGIVVHPYRRKLFWSDWARAQPKIEWSNLDGSDRSIFLSGPMVQVPNSVTIDFFTDELCWADAGTKRITCISIDTKQHRLITDSCISPFGLTVSADRYYWTERILGKIGYFDKNTRKAGNLTLPLVLGGTLYGIIDVPKQCP